MLNGFRYDVSAAHDPICVAFPAASALKDGRRSRKLRCVWTRECYAFQFGQGQAEERATEGSKVAVRPKPEIAGTNRMLPV